MSDDRTDDMKVVPLPGSENEAERRRVRTSNDRDQQAEREGGTTRHNEGYDEAADGPAAPRVERIEDE